ncbi:hypothetical protein CAOG_000412 [Capsaspora owczarzaki ATCC 30864]|uniref:Major facilitator superfamily (MFS) profile domain-containing protein n=2 Tax=Capsaspora owczarzaki (strain ATCC 30864) TaxID=595528 RepID=A0A0D2WIG9_CAPO3|nr:hypothetical protein CAOG_000412 [Capsaspora owczarzaki ATCC 30864]
MLCSPFVGWLSDHTSVKTILMVTLAVNVVGNLVYFAAQGAWMVLLGRIVAGMGACSGVVMSYVVRVTAESERTSTITKVIAAQEAGLLIGPSLAFIIQYCDFDIGPFPVTPLTSPGLLMVIVLCVSILVVAIWFVNPPSAHYIESVLNGQSGDTKPASSPDPMAQSAPPKDVSSSSQSAFSQLKARGHLKDALREIAQLHIATIFLAQFVLLFNQSTLETIVTLLTDKFYHWGQTNNSLMYMVIAATFILIYIFIHAVNHRIQDRYLIVVGLILETATFVFDMIILPNATDLPMYQFVLACGLFICGLPFFMIAVPALFSKLTSKRRQGLLQGLLQVCTSLGCICGPLWGGSSFNRFELMFGVMLAPMSLLIVMFLLSFRKLAPPPLLVSGSNALFEHDDDDDDASTTPDERRHLIN